MAYYELELLAGQTIVEIEGASKYSDEIIFKLDNGDRIKMYHEQDCCESVHLDDIDGDIDDLIGVPLQMAEESSNSGETDWGTETWTFYRFSTEKGYVTLRWHGSSNGYYGEGVYLEKL